MVAAIRSSGILWACSTARSFSGWTPVMLAVASSPSAKVTLMRVGALHHVQVGQDDALVDDHHAGAHAALEDVALERHRDDPRLVAVGEIGLDYFVPELKLSPLKERQEHFYREQLKLARRHGLPVILHVRRSADALLRALRELAPLQGWRGIAHAFNGSQQQAQAFIDLGFKLGFGGAVTYERALQLRRLAAELPLSALVLETDAPDIPPHWLYVTAEQRAAGQARQPNEPAELPRIGAVVAGLRGISVEELALATVRNAGEALPRVMEGIF
jgi:TatD DNase family protein